MPPYSSQIVTGYDIIPVTPGAGDLPDGPCRALWIGGSGTVDITTPGVGGDPIDRDGIVIATEGLFPIQCTKVRAATATDIFAIY